MHIGNRWIAAAMLVFVTGCVNLYTKIDGTPDHAGTYAFKGIRKHLEQETSFHVLQLHGMGDNTSESSCGSSSPNLKLQALIAERLGLVRVEDYAPRKPIPITIGETVGGTYSTELYKSAPGAPIRHLFFSCLTWGEASRKIKQTMLELDGTFVETNANERHRSAVNRLAKKFVNEKFSDPIIYVGEFGPFIRKIVWQGLADIKETHRSRQLAFGLTATTAQGSPMPMAVISDSLGSRVMFDVLCRKQGGCGASEVGAAILTTDQDESRKAEAILAFETEASIKSIYMLANQLPLLELASVPEPPEDKSLDTMLAEERCYQPLHTEPSSARDAPTELVAFTDANDALSYHLTERFRRRCAPNAGAMRIVNVTMPNADIRWLFVYSHLPEAHSDGFKRNKRAITSLVEGWK